MFDSLSRRKRIIVYVVRTGDYLSSERRLLPGRRISAETANRGKNRPGIFASISKSSNVIPSEIHNIVFAPLHVIYVVSISRWEEFRSFFSPPPFYPERIYRLPNYNIPSYVPSLREQPPSYQKRIELTQLLFLHRAKFRGNRALIVKDEKFNYGPKYNLIFCRNVIIRRKCVQVLNGELNSAIGSELLRQLKHLTDARARVRVLETLASLSAIAASDSGVCHAACEKIIYN